jgi:hypothetical protein
LGNSSVGAQLAASQEGLSSMQLVSLRLIPHISHVTDRNRNQNTRQNTDFRLSRWLTVGVNSFLGMLHRVDVDNVDVSEVHALTNFLSHPSPVVFLENTRSYIYTYIFRL